MSGSPDGVLPRELTTVMLVAGEESARHYAELTADFNPIHLDPQFAAGTAFGVPIIHGTMGLNLIIQSIEASLSMSQMELEIEARFIRPVPVGSVIRAGGKLLDAATGTYEIFVETEAGLRAVEGTCAVGSRA